MTSLIDLTAFDERESNETGVCCTCSSTRRQLFDYWRHRRLPKLFHPQKNAATDMQMSWNDRWSPWPISWSTSFNFIFLKINFHLIPWRQGSPVEGERRQRSHVIHSIDKDEVVLQLLPPLTEVRTRVAHPFIIILRAIYCHSVNSFYTNR